MKINVTMNPTDQIVLAVLAVLFLLGVRTVISFFRTPKPRASGEEPEQENGNGRTPETEVSGRIVLSLDGMMCGMCETHIRDAIRKALPAASGVTASHIRGEAAFSLRDAVGIGDLSDRLHGQIDPLGYRILEIRRAK